MSTRRRSYESGHKPKFLVVIDDTPECDRALYFASRRALRIGATVVMLRVIETQDRNQQRGPRTAGVEPGQERWNVPSPDRRRARPAQRRGPRFDDVTGFWAPILAQRRGLPELPLRPVND